MTASLMLEPGSPTTGTAATAVAARPRFAVDLDLRGGRWRATTPCAFRTGPVSPLVDAQEYERYTADVPVEVERRDEL